MAKKEANIVIRLRDRASGGFRKLAGSIGSVLKPLSLVTGALTAFGGIVGGLFLKRAIDEAGSFGEQMSILAGLTQGTTEQLQALEDAAREAGSTTRFTATEAGQGLEELARGGQNANEAVQSLNAVLALASGNNQSVAESAQQVITTLNQFGLEAAEAGRVSDVYTRAAQRSAQTTEQLARAFRQAGPVAAQANLTIEETSAIVGKLADAGFRGERGGTALRNALVQLSDPASKFRKELAEIGIKSTDFVEVLAQLEAKGATAGDAIRALGLESAPAIQALVASGTEGLQQLVGELNNAGGAAQEASRAMEDNLPGALRNLNSAFSDLQIELTTGLTEELKDSVLDLADGLRNFTQSDTMTSLKTLLVETFRAGRENVEEFIKSVDFDEVTRRVRNFTDAAVRKINEFRVSANELKATFDRIVGGTQVLIGGFRVAINALGVGIGTVLQLAAKQVENYLSLISKATFGLNPLVESAKREVELIRESFENSTEEFKKGLNESIGDIEEGWSRIAEAGREGAKKAADAVNDEIGDPAQEAEEHLQGLKDALRESGLSAAQLGEDVGGTAENFNEAAAGIDRMSESLGTNADASERAAESVGKINGEWVRLKDSAGEAGEAQEEAAESSDKQASATERLSESTGKQVERTKDLAGNTQELADEAEEATGRMVRLGGSIKLGATAQEQFNKALSKFQGGGTATYIQTFKRALDGALETQAEFTAAQERLTNLQQAGVSVTTNFAEANRQLRFQLMEVRGETEELARAREREQRQALESQLQLARLSGDEDRVREIQEYIQLNRRLEQERARQQRQNERDREKEAETAEEIADAEERAARAGGSSQRDVNVTVTFVANTDPNGITISREQEQRLINGVLDALEQDGRRTQ